MTDPKCHSRENGNQQQTNQCPRTFTDSAGHTKTIYCAKWTCPGCAPRKLRRLIARSAQTAAANAPLFLLTVRAPRLPVVWNRFTQRIRRPYIGAIEHRPDLHIHCIIQKPPRDARKIWESLGGTYFHLTPVQEFAQTLIYCAKTLTEEFTESRLIKSRDWHLATLDAAMTEVMQDIMDKHPDLAPPSEGPPPETSPRAGVETTRSTEPAGGPPKLGNIATLINMLPPGTKITFTITKGPTDD